MYLRLAKGSSRWTTICHIWRRRVNADAISMTNLNPMGRRFSAAHVVYRLCQGCLWSQILYLTSQIKFRDSLKRPPPFPRVLANESVARLAVLPVGKTSLWPTKTCCAQSAGSVLLLFLLVELVGVMVRAGLAAAVFGYCLRSRIFFSSTLEKFRDPRLGIFRCC